MHPHGVHELNRWVQRRFRAEELKLGRQPWGMTLGDEEIVVRDKVIQVRNQWRDTWNGRASEKLYLANGEIGIVSNRAKKRDGAFLNILNVVFAGCPGFTVGYRPKDFPAGAGPLELAYALTVHKAQGSEFNRVFVVLPRNSNLLSRELLYTALTRSRDRMVLLVEGESAAALYEFTKPERSETTRRNTNLFRAAIRERLDAVPYAEHLIHRTEKGHMVRSKSELVIANLIWRMKLDYEYERPVRGRRSRGRCGRTSRSWTPRATSSSGSISGCSRATTTATRGSGSASGTRRTGSSSGRTSSPPRTTIGAASTPSRCEKWRSESRSCLTGDA